MVGSVDEGMEHDCDSDGYAGGVVGGGVPSSGDDHTDHDSVPRGGSRSSGYGHEHEHDTEHDTEHDYDDSSSHRFFMEAPSLDDGDDSMTNSSIRTRTTARTRLGTGNGTEISNSQSMFDQAASHSMDPAFASAASSPIVTAVDERDTLLMASPTTGADVEADLATARRMDAMMPLNGNGSSNINNSSGNSNRGDAIANHGSGNNSGGNSNSNPYDRYGPITVGGMGEAPFLSFSACHWSRINLSELSGACGDFGTLIPLLVAMARERTIFLAPTLFCTGMVHIITGLLWDIPMPLQPMKSIAAIAIAGGLNRVQVTTSGIWLGLIMSALSISGGIEVVNRIVPVSVVGGVQIGVGMRLAISGMHMIQTLPWFGALDCIFTAVVCTLLCMILLKEQQQRQAAAPPQSMSLWRRLTQKPPVGLYLFTAGVVISTIRTCLQKPQKAVDELESIWFGAPVLVNALHNATSHDWKTGFLEGAIPQLPLTTLNSVISVCLLADTLFPHKRHNNHESVVSRKAVCLSVGLLNLVLCPLGAMPTCHGAGGLAGQHRLGAETGTSMIMLGVIKMAVAVLFGQSLLQVLDALPVSILGLMLCIAGHELATTGSTTIVKTYHRNDAATDDAGVPAATLRQATVIAMVTTIVIVGLGKTHYGAVCGWITHMVYGTGTLEFVSWWRWGHHDNDVSQSYHGIPQSRAE